MSCRRTVSVDHAFRNILSDDDKTTIVRLVHIVVFEFHFSFVDCNISKHKKSLYLALLDKCCVTFRTADFNTAFAFWYTYFLFTSRTFVNVMCLSLCHYTFL